MTDEQPSSRRAARPEKTSRLSGWAKRRADRADAAAASPALAGPAAPADVDAAQQAAPSPARGPFGGVLTVIRRHPTAWLISALAVAFVLLGTGAVFAGVAFGSTRVEAAPAETEEVIPPRVQPGIDSASAALRTCSVTPYAVDGRLMSLLGSVRRVDTGEQLWGVNADLPARTGSVLKVLTASAAIAQLGADYQITTSVVAGSTPGSVVLVGRGDATLSSMPPGTESVYAGAPKLSSLAAAVVASYSTTYPGQEITQLVLDSTYWSSSDRWDASWKRTEQTIGYHSEVTALQVDGDRSDPTRQTSPRSTDPVGRAGALFVEALKAADPGGVVADDIAVSAGTAVGGTVLGEVRSQPVRVLIKQMLLNSDNTIAEMLARIVSKEGGLGGSAASLDQAIPNALWPEDPTTIGRVTIVDGSGLSENNAVPADVMSDFMRRVQGGGANLDIVRDALPVAGKSGTLAGRFTGDSAVARGHVWAKTGWIDTAYTLSGFLESADGTLLSFAVYAVGDGIKDDAKAAIDTLVAGVYTCGANLARF